MSQGDISNPNSSANRFSTDLFSTFVSEEKDVIGMVAYAIFQRDMREWISKYHSVEGREPTREQIEERVSTLTEGEKERIIGEADKIVTENAGILHAKAAGYVLRELIDEGSERRPWILQGIVTNILGTICIAIFVFLGLWLAQSIPDIADIFRQMNPIESK